MRYELGNGTVLTGWEAFKTWLIVGAFFIFVIAVCVGIYLLKTYRWGF